MKFCPSCGTENQDASHFCARCGGALPSAPPRSHEYGGDAAPPREAGQMPPRAGPPYGSPHAAAPGPYSPPEQYPPPQGHPQNGGYTPQGYRPPGPDMRGLESGEQIAVFLGSLCISPIVAIVLYFVWKDDKPQKASEVCRLGWWVVGTWFALYALFFLIAILMA